MAMKVFQKDSLVSFFVFLGEWKWRLDSDFSKSSSIEQFHILTIPTYASLEFNKHLGVKVFSKPKREVFDLTWEENLK